MRIDQLSLENFRNYEKQTVSFHPSCNVICGENAQGKTNLLEAVACLSFGKSPRTRIDKELIQFGANSFIVEGMIQSRERDFLTRIEVATGRKKKMSVNKVPAKTASELSSIFNTIFFTPEDLYLIREGATQRRRFMDTSLCQLRPRYAAALTEYNRLWEHKTRILRDCEEHPDLLDAVDFCRSIGSPAGEFLQFDGMKFRSDKELATLLKGLQEHGIKL
ncbi:MAG: DNA replication and repair protein RecF, partial [Oscillospiraceae bacterium]|nr:DNA replication and repair protein RecF [Oscillospiraceae bacterium]